MAASAGRRWLAEAESLLAKVTAARLVALPADSRPLPTVSAYDQLLTRPRTSREGQS